jgi:hypothetical protein
MSFFKCRVCGRIREFKPWPNPGSTCVKCFTKDSWQPYFGPVADSLLEEEDRQHEIALGEYSRRRAGKKNAEDALREHELKYRQRKSLTREEVLSVMTTIDLCRGVIADMERQMRPYAETLDLLGDRVSVHRDAKTAHETAASQGQMYLGNRQYVSTFILPHEHKILDVPNWSWGLNCAWVEGGIKARAHYEVKINGENQFTQIPNSVRERLNGVSMDADTFLDLCEAEGAGSLLWYNKDGANRPTWTALEMATLLRSGYTFDFGAVVTLRPPV